MTEAAGASLHARAVEQLRTQADVCRHLGSPLYAELLAHAAADAERGGPTWHVLRPHAAPSIASAVPLRFMAAVHRMVLQGRAPGLAEHYPSAGGTAGIEGAWEPFRRLLEERWDEVSDLVGRPCQTNEVGRCAALVVGFLEIAAVTGLPIRLRELGTSAGLNLRWDRYRYEGGGAEWGEPSSPVRLRDLWAAAAPHLDAPVEVAERAGCDPDPVDPFTDEGRLALTASVWADQLDRLAHLSGALELAARVPARVDRAAAADWLEERLGPAPGFVTVVFHSVTWQYLSPSERERVRGALDTAGTRARRDAPVAWLRMEPVTDQRRMAVDLTVWPGGTERRVATALAHGSETVPVAT